MLLSLIHIWLGKGQAVAWLARHLGIDREQVMCFGDNTNDASMLRAAGVGVAMGNAVAELKAQACLLYTSRCV